MRARISRVHGPVRRPRSRRSSAAVIAATSVGASAGCRAARPARPAGRTPPRSGTAGIRGRVRWPCASAASDAMPAPCASASVRSSISTGATETNRTTPAGVRWVPPGFTRGASQRRNTAVIAPSRIPSCDGQVQQHPVRSSASSSARPIPGPDYSASGKCTRPPCPSRTVTRSPPPSTGTAPTVPPWAATTARTIDNPSPVPR